MNVKFLATSALWLTMLCNDILPHLLGLVYISLTFAELFTQGRVEYTNTTSIKSLIKQYQPEFPRIYYRSLQPTTLDYWHTNGTHTKPPLWVSNVTSHQFKVYIVYFHTRLIRLFH